MGREHLQFPRRDHLGRVDCFSSYVLGVSICAPFRARALPLGLATVAGISGANGAPSGVVIIFDLAFHRVLASRVVPHFGQAASLSEWQSCQRPSDTFFVIVNGRTSAGKKTLYTYGLGR